MQDLFSQATTILAQNNGKAKLLEEMNTTGWFSVVTKVFEAATHVADWLGLNDSVIVQASDNWDYSSTITSLVQVMLCPHYRSFAGFCTLVDKEFCHGGYLFESRSGRARKGSSMSGSSGSLLDRASKSTPDSSPTLFLFFWCIWCLVTQSPKSFEFDETLLIFLIDSIYSGRFKEFCFNSHRERSSSDAAYAPSLWNYLHHYASYFRSPREVDSSLSFTPLTIKTSIWARLLFRSNFSLLMDQFKPDGCVVSHSIRVNAPILDAQFSSLCVSASQNAITEVFVVKNLLTALPEELGALSEVQRLTVDENLLSSFPSGLLDGPQTKALQYLRCATIFFIPCLRRKLTDSLQFAR
jgi:hypothetical protein